MLDRTFREQDGPADERSGRDPKVVLMAGGVLAALALAGGVLVLGGGEAEQVTLAAVHAPPVAASPVSDISPSPSPSAVTLNPVGRARDPFRALHVVTTGDGDGAGASPVPSGAPAAEEPVVVPLPEDTLPPLEPAPEVPVGELPVDPFPVGPTLGPVPPAAPAPSASPSAAPATSITLSRVLTAGDEVTAEFRVGGTTASARTGEQIGDTDVRLLSLQQDPEDNHWTAVLKKGAGEPFDAVIGVAVRVP